MARPFLNIALAAVLVVAAVGLLLLAMRFHDQYGKAHAMASERGWVPGQAPVFPLGHSPQHFLDLAEYSALGVCGIALMAVIAGVKTRAAPWVLCAVACTLIAAAAIIETGYVY